MIDERDVTQLGEEELVDLGVEELRRVLPSQWSAEKLVQPGAGGRPAVFQLLVSTAGVGATAALVEVRRSFSPNDARRLFGNPMGQRLRAMAGNTAVIVVAPYLSPRSRELLAADGVGYIDLAGNVRLDLANLFVQIDKANTNPTKASPRVAGLRGAMSGMVVRVLADARPPYTLTAIARAAGVDRGYASRILDGLVDQALIEREPRGMVTDVDWPALLRARAEHLDLLAAPAAKGCVAPRGARHMLGELADRPPQGLWAVTGSFAAGRYTLVAAPSLLVVYTMHPRALVANHGLFEVDEGGDVMVVRPSYFGPFERTQEAKGIVWAGLSQLVVDCLSGNGRMPAEGEALLGWMAGHQGEWRMPIEAMPAPIGQP